VSCSPSQAVAVLACIGLCLTLAAAQDQPPTTRPATKPTSRTATQPRAFPYNGDFEVRAESRDLPDGWTTKHPANVRLVDTDGPHGLVVEMSGRKRLMASYGVDLTSEKIPVKPNTRYRCTGCTKSAGPKMKVFIKGFATVTRRVQGELKTFDDIVYQMRKDIDPSDGWELFNLDFEIIPADVFSDFRHRITYVRIRLWAFWPEGTCWFDDISFQEVGPVPEAERRHADGVTHVGLPPRLGDAARPATQPAAEMFDEQQTWRNAVNAFRSGDYAKAAPLAERLVAHAPHNGAYRILAARALCELERWHEAEQHTRWLLKAQTGQAGNEESGPGIEPWQRDWAQVVQAQVYLHTGRSEGARKVLQEFLRDKTNASPHARAAAEKLRAKIEADPGKR
jgi:hypothetical protein